MKLTSETTVAEILNLLDEANKTGKNLYYKTEALDHPLRLISAKYPWGKSKGGMPPSKDKTKIVAMTTNDNHPVIRLQLGSEIYIN